MNVYYSKIIFILKHVHILSQESKVFI